MKTTTFHNVTISINADNSKKAYAKLCDVLQTIDAEWTTDTYTDTDTASEEARETTELFG